MNQIKVSALFVVLLSLLIPSASAQGRPVIVVMPFVVGLDAVLPYDMQQLQAVTHAELKARFVKQPIDIALEAPANPPGKVYVITGEFSNWKAGSTAKRVLVGFGSGREGVDFHFTITESGKKVVDKKERIKSQFIGSAYQGNVGQLGHPIADKIGDAIKSAKLVPNLKQ